MTGTIFYLLTCFQGPMHSLRTVNAIVSKTDWIVGHAHMAVLGAFRRRTAARTVPLTDFACQRTAALGSRVLL